MLKYLNMKVFYIFILFFLTLTTQVSASSSGTIDLVDNTALICYSVDCVSPTPSVINFLPTGPSPITITDTSIDGLAWGSKIGWINLNPTGSEGLTINPSTGIISGKAWSQVSGWINFAPTGQSVSINNDGEFEGYAWTGGHYGGWIKFDCDFAGACVKTDWMPTSDRTAVSAGNPVAGSGGSTVPNDFLVNDQVDVDMCLNLPGYQSKLPDGYAKDLGGFCLLDVDYCKNIEGNQLTIPNDYVLDGSGQCVILNNENKDYYFPEKLTTSLTEVYPDFCPNLFGMQSRLPDGFILYEKDCLPEEVDYCSNMLGNQYSIPEKMKISDEGRCVKMSTDEISDYEKNKNTEIKVLAFGFVPTFIMIPVKIPLIEGLFGVNYKVDLISLFILLNILSVIFLFIKNRINI